MDAMLKKTLLVAVILFTSLHPAFAQAPIEVVDRSQSDDTTGKQLVYHFREEVRKSQAFALTLEDVPRVKVVIHTMPRSVDDKSLATIYSIVWLFANEKDSNDLNSTLGYAGRSRVEEAAKNLLAETDRLMETLARAMQQQTPK